MAAAGKAPAWRRADGERLYERDGWRRYRGLLLFIAVCICLLLTSEWIGHRKAEPVEEPASSGWTSSGSTKKPYQYEITDSHASILRPGGASTGPEMRISDEKEGILFGADYHEPWYSPNRMNRLIHTGNGDLVLESQDGATESWAKVWWTNTGSAIGSGLKGKTIVSLDSSIMRITVEHDESRREHTEVKRIQVWHSGLLSQCSTPPSANASNTHAALRLDNAGRLEIRGAAGETLCVLHDGNRRALTVQQQYGRLALIVTGLYRTLPKTCPTHVEKIINAWPGTAVDVFVYTYFESDPEVRALQVETIRMCYGENLKDYRIDEIKEVEEAFPNPLPPNCNQSHIDRLHSQLKTVSNAAQLLDRHVFTNGTQFDAIMRIRPDTDFHGEPPRLPSPAELGPNKIVAPHPDGERYYWCHKVDGSIGIGPTDQLMYGSREAAMVWMDMHHSFPTLGTYGQIGNGYVSYTGCEDGIPKAAGKEQCVQDIDTCIIECMVSYYLSHRAIEFVVDWEWGHNILRI